MQDVETKKLFASLIIIRRSQGMAGFQDNTILAMNFQRMGTMS